MDPVELVKQGYDAVAEQYLAERLKDSADVRLLSEIEARVPEGGEVLDLGCGAGVPVAARLSRRYRVTGIDISPAQVELARANVPTGTFHVGDMIDFDLGQERYDAVVSYYAMIHVPRDEHRSILRRVQRCLRRGGLALLCLGAQDLPSDVDPDYFGRPMYWSHFSHEIYLQMLAELGFPLVQSWLVTDDSWPNSQHLFVLLQNTQE